MNQDRKEELVARLVSGLYMCELYGTTYVVHPTKPQDRYLGQLAYNKAYEEMDFEPCFTRDSICNILVSLKLIPQDVDEQLKRLEGDTEKLKHQLYLNHLDPQSKQIRAALKSTRNAHALLLQARHSLDHLTKEGYAESARIYSIFSSCLTDLKGKKVDNVDIIEKVLIRYNHNKIDNSEFREIARTDPWRSYWSASHNVFGKSSKNLTDDQRIVVVYSKLYDSVYKAYEPPPEYIVHDDDLLDGWLIDQKETQKREKNKKAVKGLKGVSEKANEVFIMAKDKKHVNDIHDMNDLQGKLVKKQRAEALKVKGKLDEAQLPDVKRDLQMQAQQQVMDKFKRKK